MAHRVPNVSHFSRGNFCCWPCPTPETVLDGLWQCSSQLCLSAGEKKCYSWIYHRLVHKKYPVCLSWVPYFSSSYHTFMLKTHPFTTEHIWKQREYKNQFWLFPSRVTCSLEAGVADGGRTWTSSHGTYTVPASRCICPPPFWIDGANATWLTALPTTGNTEAVSRNSRSCVFFLILMTEIQTIKVRNYVILQWKMDFFNLLHVTIC